MDVEGLHDLYDVATFIIKIFMLGDHTAGTVGHIPSYRRILRFYCRFVMDILLSDCWRTDCTGVKYQQLMEGFSLVLYWLISYIEIQSDSTEVSLRLWTILICSSVVISRLEVTNSHWSEGLANNDCSYFSFL